MKKIVVFDEYNEIDFKPSDLLHKYIELTEKDVNDFFLANHALTECNCPGCQSDEALPAFSKFSMRYVECARCHTVYISPRPDDKALRNYYINAESRKYFYSQVSKLTVGKRKEKIIKPRFQWIMDSTEEYCHAANQFADINLAQYGYIDEMVNTKIFDNITLIDPFINLDNMKSNHNVNIINTPVWEINMKEKYDVISIFEVADHTPDINALFGKVNDLLKNEGLCVMTAILISGFNLQTLWDKAENIFPPDRLNVFSVEGLNTLFERHNFECLEFSTPGILDVEMVINALKDNQNLEVSRFTKYLLSKGEDVRKSFQEFLQEGLMSSYGRILLRKRS